MPLTHARVAAFGSTRRKGVAVEEDQGLADLLACGAPVVTIVGKTWDAQVTRALQTSLEENLAMIGESVRYLKEAGRHVVFDAEHFFDGYKANPDYAVACLLAAHEAGADSIDLCETNGGALPFEVEEIVASVVERVPDQAIGIHCHDDAGCAVANAVAAVRAGATCVQGTVNGIGERVGNTDLLTAIANLELKMGKTCVGRRSCAISPACRSTWPSCATCPSRRIIPTPAPRRSRTKAGCTPAPSRAFPPRTSTRAPEAVGNNSHLLVSELAGKASLVQKAAGLGIDLMEGGVDVQELLDDIKERESQGYSYEVADGSLALLLMRKLGLYEPVFTLESFRVIVDDREDTGVLAKDAMSEATIKIHVGERRFVATGEGAGPIGALDNALRLAISESYPEISAMELVDYKVRLLDESQGTDAITRVTIITQDGRGVYGTVGVSEKVIEASWNALAESIEYGLMRLR